MPEDDITYIVGSDDDMSEPVRGSKLYPCSKCSRLVWLAPSGQAMVKAGAIVLCIADAMEIEDQEFGIAPGAKEELLAKPAQRRSRN